MTSVLYRVEFAGGGQRFVAVERVEGPSAAWSLQIDATDGLESLLGRGYLRSLDDDLILLFTEGEHLRTGAAYNHKVHRITRDGRVLWTIRARPVGDPMLYGGLLLLPVAPVAPRLAMLHHSHLVVQQRLRDVAKDKSFRRFARREQAPAPMARGARAQPRLRPHVFITVRRRQPQPQPGRLDDRAVVACHDLQSRAARIGAEGMTHP